MKDITDDVLDSLFNDNEKMMKRRKVKILGEDTHIPFDIFKTAVTKIRYYESNNLSEILRDYKRMSETTNAGMKLVRWALSLAAKSVKNKQFSYEFKKQSKAYGSDYDRIVGQKRSLLDKLTMNVISKNAFILTGMSLDRFEHHEFPLFTAEVFRVTDTYNNEMKGVRITEHLSHQLIDWDTDSDTNTKLLEIKSGSQHPFLIQCSAIKADVPTLLVKHIQDGGKEVPITPIIM